MKKFLEVLILIGSLIVLGIIIIGLTEANAKMFNHIGDMGYFPYYINKWIPLIKSVGFSLGTIVVVVYYRKPYIKLFFIALDIFIIWTFYYLKYDSWKDYIGFAYAIYTGLVFAYIGNIVHLYFREKVNNKKEDSENIKSLSSENKVLKDQLMIIRLKKKITNLKRTGKNGADWQTLPDKVAEIEKLEDELKKIKLPDDTVDAD